MSLFWTAPLALLGVAFIALPIAVHLLVRHQVRTLQFPSLRFLRETQLAAFRWHRVEDLALLICRCAIVATAAVALAGPVLQTASRDANQSTRISRAIVMVGNVPGDAAEALGQGAFASTTIQRDNTADAVRDATRWLDTQPRSAREILVAGELRRGTIAPADFSDVPSGVGLRFEQRARDLPGELPVGVLAYRNDTLVRIEQTVTLRPDSTRLTEGPASPIAGDLVSIVANQQDQTLADAALRAALDAGVPWRDFGKRVVIVWDGADGTVVSARSNRAALVRMPVPGVAAGAADAVRDRLTRAAGVAWVEPIAITRAELDSLSRPPGAPSANAPVADEGDRRWLWGLVLALLGGEWWLRRPSKITADARASGEARVA